MEISIQTTRNACHEQQNGRVYGDSYLGYRRLPIGGLARYRWGLLIESKRHSQVR